MSRESLLISYLRSPERLFKQHAQMRPYSLIVRQMTRERGAILFLLIAIALVVYTKVIVSNRNSNPNPSGGDQSAKSDDEGQAEETHQSVTADNKINVDLLNQSGWGNTEKVRSLLRAGADVNARDTNGDTPLIVAAFHGLSETAKILLEQGADLNAKNDIGNTALMEAAGMNKAETVRLLLAGGADVNAKNIIGLSALDAAREKEYRNIVRLLQTGASTPTEQINLKKAFARSDLNPASMDGNAEKTRSLVELGADINARSKTGSTALIGAASRGNIDAVRSLLANNANPNLADNKDGRTPLIVATMEGHTEVVRALLSSGADPNKKDKSGNTAISMVQRTGQSQIGRLLKQAGARVPSYVQVLSERKP
jgi:ankyrin repeat protein